MFYDVNQFDKAMGFLKKSISCNPKAAVSLYCLGEIYYKTSALNEAKTMFSNTVALDGSNYKAHYFLGLILKKQGDIEWAMKEFEVAQKSDDLKVRCFTAKGLIYHETEEYGKAIGEFEQGLKYVRSGTESALNLRYYIADCYERTRDITSAIKNWEIINESNRAYKDVPDKLRQFGEFRQDDRIKDFMIASLPNFENICRKIVSSMNCNIGEVYQAKDSCIDLIANELESNWRSGRQNNKLIKIIRTTDPVQESVLRALLDEMKPRNATRAMIITAGEYSSKAMDFANTRPIDLLGKVELIELLKRVM
jgi:tetratricopeptide (TPR) repeat protein